MLIKDYLHKRKKVEKKEKKGRERMSRERVRESREREREIQKRESSEEICLGREVMKEVKGKYQCLCTIYHIQ